MAVAYLIIPVTPGLQAVPSLANFGNNIGGIGASNSLNALNSLNPLSAFGSLNVLGSLNSFSGLNSLGSSTSAAGLGSKSAGLGYPSVSRSATTDARRNRGLYHSSKPSNVSTKSSNFTASSSSYNLSPLAKSSNLSSSVKSCNIPPVLTTSLPQLVVTGNGLPLLLPAGLGSAVGPIGAALPSPAATAFSSPSPASQSLSSVASVATPPAAVVPQLRQQELNMFDSVRDSWCVSALASASNTTSATVDPLAGWMQPKTPVAAASWEFPMGELSGDSSVALAEAELSFPDDLEELLLASPESVPALPADDANMLLEELISGSVRASPELFGELPGTGLAGDCADQGLSAAQALYGDQGLSGQVAPRGGGMALQPETFNDPNSLQQQLAGETWAPALSPSEMEPWSPTGSSDSDFGLDAWSPLSETPAGRRRQARPRPYDKPEAGEGGGGRRHLTEEERRLRKKEQNKNAATRYRQKKKEEQEIVSLDQDALEGRNKELRDNVAGLTKELQYLRQLMREVIRHKHAV